MSKKAITIVSIVVVIIVIVIGIGISIAKADVTRVSVLVPPANTVWTLAVTVNEVATEQLADKLVVRQVVNEAKAVKLVKMVEAQLDSVNVTEAA